MFKCGIFSWMSHTWIFPQSMTDWRGTYGQCLCLITIYLLCSVSVAILTSGDRRPMEWWRVVTGVPWKSVRVVTGVPWNVSHVSGDRQSHGQMTSGDRRPMEDDLCGTTGFVPSRRKMTSGDRRPMEDGWAIGVYSHSYQTNIVSITTYLGL